MTTLDIIKKRKSIRAFNPEKIEGERILSLFEAARWAPSAYNSQPWRFYYSTRENMEKFNEMIACMIEFNQIWAKNAYMIVIAAARKTFEHNGKPNLHSWYDLGQSVANLAIEATAQGLFVHQMSGFDHGSAGKFINDQEFEPVTMIAIGNKGDSSLLPTSISEMEHKKRERKPLEQIVFQF